jgi:hypothetical protein
MRRASTPLAQRQRAAADGRAIGMFSGNEPVPQQPTDAIAGELQNSLMDQPGIRLAEATGRRVFFSGALYPQAFTRAPSPVNEDANVRAGYIGMATRRTVGRARAQLDDLRTEEGF